MQWRRLGGLAVFAVGVANTVAEPLRGVRDARNTDYVSFISAARILARGSRNLYSLAEQHAAQTAYLGFTPSATVANPFLNPAPCALALVPLTGLSRSAGIAIFLAVALLCLAVTCRLAYRHILAPLRSGRHRAVLVVASVCSLPAGMALALGQWDPFVLAPLAAAVVWLSQRRRAFAAGLLLAFIIIKPQLGFLIPVLLVAAGCWRTIAGMAAGAAAWVVASYAIVGSHLADWPRLVISSDAGPTVQTLGIPGFAGMLVGTTTASFVTWMACSSGVVVLAWRMRRSLRANPGGALALGIGLSLLCAPHLWPDDLILLSIPLLWWARSEPGPALAAALLLSAAFGVDVAIGPLTGPHLETFPMLAAVGGLALAIGGRSSAELLRTAVVRSRTQRRALPSTPR
jgi:hypothetical protein